MVRTPVQAPKANACAERWVGTVRRECLDWLLIIGERHLRQVLREYVDHYSTTTMSPRLIAHWGCSHHSARQPSAPPAQRPASVGAVGHCDRLGGLLHEYERVAA